MVNYYIDRTELPYDAMVNDPSWLAPVADAVEVEETAKTEEVNED